MPAFLTKTNDRFPLLGNTTVSCSQRESLVFYGTLDDFPFFQKRFPVFSERQPFMNHIFNQPVPTVTECVTLTPDADGTVTQMLAQNRLYSITSSPALASLTLTAATGLLYCGLDFVTGSTAPTLAYPSGWTWTGADCVSGAFTPRPNKSYRVAFKSTGANLAATVQEVR